jgi:hypothetical protein
MKQAYPFIARAFGGSREGAKKRLLSVMYGAKPASSEPRLLGLTWKAHLDALLDDVRGKRWRRASKALAQMISHAIDQADIDDEAKGAAVAEYLRRFGKDD